VITDLTFYNLYLTITCSSQARFLKRSRLATPSKVNKYFDLPQCSIKIVTILGDDVTVEVAYLEDIELME